MVTENPLTFTRNDDGTIAVKDEQGSEIRYAKESDLLAVKGSTEAAEKRLKDVQDTAQQAQDTNKVEIGTANANLETTRQQVIQAEAKIEELEGKVKEGAGSAEELAKVKQDLETAQTSGEELKTKALEYRRTIIVATYGIPADTVKEKTMEQLDNYEEALKSVLATKGIGNYAIGGGVGGGSLAGKSPMELAIMAYGRSNK